MTFFATKSRITTARFPKVSGNGNGSQWPSDEDPPYWWLACSPIGSPASAPEWNTFTNTYGVTTLGATSQPYDATMDVTVPIFFPTTDYYQFRFSVDDYMDIYLDSELIASASVGTSRIGQFAGGRGRFVVGGSYNLRVVASNGGGTNFGFAITIAYLADQSRLIWDTRNGCYSYGF